MLGHFHYQIVIVLTRLGRKQLAAEQSKWQALSRAMGLILNPVEEESK